jgi:polyketide biosynthesis enoyl-CoA hydratase PksH
METVRARFEGRVCWLTLHRPEAKNGINRQLIDECSAVLDSCAGRASVIVVEGSPEVFCVGADFQGIRDQVVRGTRTEDDAARLYALWLRLANGSHVSVAHVRGAANAGGIGFVAACDIALAAADARFSLSEMLFGLFPACVMPFLVRRVGVQRAHYLTLTTKPIDARQAQAWGLVDACEENTEPLLRQYVRRLGYLAPEAIAEYKAYMTRLNEANGSLADAQRPALDASARMFANPRNLAAIRDFVDTGRFPWEAAREEPVDHD